MGETYVGWIFIAGHSCSIEKRYRYSAPANRNIERVVFQICPDGYLSHLKTSNGYRFQGTELNTYPE